jgi:hypothetical protein
MTRFMCMCLIAVPLTASAGGRSYNGETAIDHDCSKEPEVSVNASDATATFKGTCEKIAINGSNSKITVDGVKRLAITGSANTLTLDAVDKIAVTGSGNTVTYKKGLSGAKAKVSSLGKGNKVMQAK